MKYHVALQYVHKGHLYYLEFSPPMEPFKTSEEASEFIKSEELPLGWVIISEKQLIDNLYG